MPQAWIGNPNGPPHPQRGVNMTGLNPDDGNIAVSMTDTLDPSKSYKYAQSRDYDHVTDRKIALIKQLWWKG